MQSADFRIEAHNLAERFGLVQHCRARVQAPVYGAKAEQRLYSSADDNAMIHMAAASLLEALRVTGAPSPAAGATAHSGSNLPSFAGLSPVLNFQPGES